MPDVTAQIDFLARLPLYDKEKPYLMLPSAEQNLDPDETRLDNLEFESKGNIKIHDMRLLRALDIHTHGFEYRNHISEVSTFTEGAHIESYRNETQQYLKQRFGAEHVVTYEVRLRRNEDFRRKQFDAYDKLLVEGPAKGAHNDVTYNSGPTIIQRYLTAEAQDKYLRPGYRVRIFNTWRPLNNVLKDRPLALCDSSTVAPEDLIAADRILPDRVGEVYYLHYNEKQQWYWLENQANTEIFTFLMYDTHSGIAGARFCPHVSFDIPHKEDDAEPRSSIETRSVVVTIDG